MQLDSLHSLQDPAIHPNATSNSTSESTPVSSDLDCNSLVAFEPSLQPLVLDTFILSSSCSSGSPTTPSSACSNTSSCSDISSTSTLVDVPFDRSPKNEGTAFASVNSSSRSNSKESLLFALPNDSEPLDLPNEPCLPLHLQLEQQQQQKQYQEKQKAHLVPLATAYPSPALTTTTSNVPEPDSVDASCPTLSSSCSSSPAPTFTSDSSLLNHHFCRHQHPDTASTENEQSDLEFDRDSTSDTINDEDKDRGNNPDTIESPLKAQQHPHIIYSTVPATTTTTTTTTATSSTTTTTKSTATTKVTRTSASATTTKSATTTTSASETLELDLGPTTQALFSAQLDPVLLGNVASVTPMAQDHYLRGEKKLDEPQDLRPRGQWCPALADHSSRTNHGSHIDSGSSDLAKEDGIRFKDPLEALVRGMGRERKRSTGMVYDSTSSDRKRRKNHADWGLKQSSSNVTTTSTETAAHLLRFLERRFEQRCPAVTPSCSESKQVNKMPFFRQKTSLDFDPSLLLNSWSSPSSQGVDVTRPTTTFSSHRRLLTRRQPYFNSLDCRQQHASPDKCQCRKRIFEDAIELSRPLAINAEVASHHPNWIESVKKRKVHQNATKWTSALSPAPYVRLLTLRNFWEMMEPRQDLSWRTEDDSSRCGQDNDVDEEDNGNTEDRESLEMETESVTEIEGDRSARRLSQPNCVRTVKHYPCPGHFLRGLWEEELRNQRVRQMIPDTVRKPIRGKIYHAKPILTLNKQTKPSFPSLITVPSSSSNSAAEGTSAGTDVSTTDNKDGACEATQGTASTTSSTELELSLKKKHRAAAIIRSHAITEGSDMSEYKPWKDGTVTPRQGSLQALKASRSNIMDPWPVEEAKSKDECMRVLHRMREQLNIVINLQIHLRSMMKTAPAQWSFLLSIRHPGQVSIELLLALYGPHFMQTSNFRAIEELLWGAKGHSQQPAPTIEAASSSSPALVQT